MLPDVRNRSFPEGTCPSLKFDNLNPPASVPIVQESAWQHPDFVAPLVTFFSVPAGYDLATYGSATIAPGGIEAYTSAGIPGWRSSLLVTGMRTGAVYRVRLNDDGTAMAGAPLEYFRRANRYRDTAVSPDGGRIFVVTDSFGSVLDEQWKRTETLAEPGALLEFTYVPPTAKE